MRRRSTLVHDPDLEINPRQLILSGRTFSIKDLKAAREERLTFGFDELPQELWQTLKQSHELHVRWSTGKTHNASAPFLSQLSPGLHVYYTPLKRQQTDLLCPLLHEVFSDTLKCTTPNATFSSPSLVSSQFASAASLQYHSLLPRLGDFVAYIQRKICKRSDQSCSHSASLLNIADSVDIDYDSIAHALTVTARWSNPPAAYYDPFAETTKYDRWDIDFGSQKGDKVEIGIFSASDATDPHELQLSGVLTVVGEDQHPKPTLFSFPSRHHVLARTQQQSQAYSLSFRQPTGLHPTLQFTFPDASALLPPSTKPPGSTCALHTYLTLPSALFADKYQLSTTDSLFLASHNLVSLRSISGETDLEAPNYVVQKWGSNLLLELATPDLAPGLGYTGTWDITVPLHLRYLASAPGGQSQIEVPWPVVFWACTAEEGTRFPVNPFDRVNLGYDGLFGPRTMFYHLSPSSYASFIGPEALVESINVPVLDSNTASPGYVEAGTVIVIFAGFAWTLWRLWPSLLVQIDSLMRTAAWQGGSAKKSQ